METLLSICVLIVVFATTLYIELNNIFWHACVFIYFYLQYVQYKISIAGRLLSYDSWRRRRGSHQMHGTHLPGGILS